MDASSSQKRKRLATGAPDSQTVNVDIVSFLIEGKLPQGTNIPNKVWIEVITRFLWRLDAYFKYLDGLKTIEQIIIDGEWLGCPGGTKMTIGGMTFIGEINKKTRGFFIHTLRHSPYGNGQIPISYTNLILTEGRQWIKWHVTRIETACSSQFTLLNDEELVSLINANSYSGYNIMDKLYLILSRSTTQKAQRLASLEKLEKRAQQICHRAL